MAFSYSPFRSRRGISPARQADRAISPPLYCRSSSRSIRAVSYTHLSVLVGGSLGSLLCRVIRIRDPVLVQAYKEQHDERNTMICEKAAAWAARVMQGAVLYFGAAYARFLELPMWITWGLVGFCLAWGLLEWGLTLWYRHRM